MRPATCLREGVSGKEFFWCTGLFPWHESDGSASRFSAASCPTGRVAAGGSALLRQQGRARSRSGADCRLARRGASQADSRAVLVTACCTDTASMVHQRLAHADEAALRTAGGARWARTRTRSQKIPKRRVARMMKNHLPPVFQPSSHHLAHPAQDWCPTFPLRLRVSILGVVAAGQGSAKPIT